MTLPGVHACDPSGASLDGRDSEGPVLDEGGGHPGRGVNRRGPERKQELDTPCHENVGLRRALHERRKSERGRFGPTGCPRMAQACSTPFSVMGDSSSGLDSVGTIKHMCLWVVRMPSILLLHKGTKLSQCSNHKGSTIPIKPQVDRQANIHQCCPRNDNGPLSKLINGIGTHL